MAPGGRGGGVHLLKALARPTSLPPIFGFADAGGRVGFDDVAIDCETGHLANKREDQFRHARPTRARRASVTPVTWPQAHPPRQSRRSWEAHPFRTSDGLLTAVLSPDQIHGDRVRTGHGRFDVRRLLPVPGVAFPARPPVLLALLSAAHPATGVQPPRCSRRSRTPDW